MRLPLSIATITTRLPEKKWQRQFVDNGRERHEGIWRRTQEPNTAHNSGYASVQDARWKIVHFLDRYGLERHGDQTTLSIIEPYLMWNVALPSDELIVYRDKTEGALQKGGWEIDRHTDGSIVASRGDLIAHFRYLDHDEAERLSGRTVPGNYQVFESELYSKNGLPNSR